MQISICNQPVTNYKDLIHAMFHSAQTFYLSDGYLKLMDRKIGSDLYAFLYDMGYQTLIDETWASAKDFSEDIQFTLLLSALENIADIEGVDASIIRNFFILYGPVGIATYTKSLVDDTEQPVYEYQTSEGAKILRSIRDFQPTEAATVVELNKAYMPLMRLIHQMRVFMEDNPYALSCGIYDEADIICTNLKGCFGFRIFNQTAPLGFEARISDDGTEGCEAAFEQRIFLDMLALEAEDPLTSAKKELEDLRSISRSGSNTMHFTLIGNIIWLVVFAYLYHLLRGKVHTIVAVSTLIISLLLILSMLLQRGFHVVRVHYKNRLYQKVRHIERKICENTMLLDNYTKAFHSAQKHGWHYPLEITPTFKEDIKLLQNRSIYNRLFSFESLMDFISEILYYISPAAWTLSASLALCNIFELPDKFPLWVIIVGIVISIAITAWASYRIMDEIMFLTNVSLLNILIGPAVFALFMLSATGIGALFTLVTSVFAWFTSIWPILVIIAIIIIIAKYS